jgi:hypothetical protein
VVGLCLALWLGGAALACGVFIPEQLAPQPDAPLAAAPVVVPRDAASQQLAAARAPLTETLVTLAKP